MLEMRIQCEGCNRKFTNSDTDVMICSHECTFCKECVENMLNHICPNCGGNFQPRPTRVENNGSLIS